MNVTNTRNRKWEGMVWSRLIELFLTNFKPRYSPHREQKTSATRRWLYRRCSVDLSTCTLILHMKLRELIETNITSSMSFNSSLIKLYYFLHCIEGTHAFEFSLHLFLQGKMTLTWSEKLTSNNNIHSIIKPFHSVLLYNLIQSNY